jgi:hypothetical protein
MNTRPFFSTVLMALAALLSACGGDSQLAGINGGGISNGGNSDTGVVVGPITGFGSIFVNGIEFDLNGSTNVTVDGVPNLGQTALGIGQIVTVKGTINQSTGMGTASSIEYSNNLKGKVTAVYTANNTFTVIGQTVKVTGTTVFEGLASLADLKSTDYVEVSGFVDTSGNIEATRVELQASSNNVELSGTVSSLPDPNSPPSSPPSFTIGATTVSYSLGVPVNGGSLEIGACVEVKGSYIDTQINASRIDVKSCGLPSSPYVIGEIQGIITTSLSGSTFKIGTQTISITNTTQYNVSGTPASLLVAGPTAVEVEGTFDNSPVPVLVARKIEIKQGTDVRMTGLVDVGSVNIAAKTFTMYGVTVSTNASTQFVNKLGNSNDSYSLINLQDSNFVEVRGYENATHTAMTAVTLERRNPDSRFEIQATATNSAPSATAFSLLGIPVSAASSILISKDDHVRARGTWSSATSTFSATSVENNAF